ncbi:WYL domain-containing protein, partial [Vibrio sp. 10N.261.49.A5]|uniref:WYL domain-containing protein n=1 Tax=Vibrio sp. 10N.261.49.A5 TaxID=3229670 RepID=UPI00354D5390
MFEKLIESIQRRNVISFSCNGKSYDVFHPYRLVNDRGQWYLAGTHRNHLESLRVAKIRELVRYEDKYSPDLNVEHKLIGRGHEDELPHPVEVVIQISGRISEAFFKEHNPNDFRALKEQGCGDV